MDPRWELRRALRFIRDAWPQSQADQHGHVYRGPADFVLREGSWWKPAPHDLMMGQAKRCYGNSIAGVVLHGLRYVEGYAIGEVNMPIHHAWNVDADGRVVDLTWPNTRPLRGLAYLGVEFALWRADDCTWNGDATVLDDWVRGWPLLRERWRGETEPPEGWEPSVLLRAAQEQVAGRELEAAILLANARREAYGTK